MKTFVVAYLGSLLASLLLTPLVARLARWLRCVDLPNARKVHTDPIPRLGGIAVFVAAIAAILPAMLLPNLIGDAFRSREATLIYVLIGATLVFLTGLLDDVRGVASLVKLAVVLGASALLCRAGVRINHIALGNWLSLDLGVFSWPVTMLWISGITVGINFIDGLDGLAAGISAIACCVIAAFAAAYGQMVTALLAFALLGSLTGFLYHNFHPAKIFMGDCGSLTIGFLMAAASVMSATFSQSFLGVLVPAVTLTVPILDTFFTLIRRGVVQRRPLFAAERGHIHHRLLDMGLNQRQVVLMLYGATMISAAAGVLMFLTQSVGILSLTAAFLMPLALFRVTGLARLRRTASALMQTHRLVRRQKAIKDIYADMELRLKAAGSFAQWWDVVISAAEQMGVARLALALENRDGTTRVVTWSRPGDEPLAKKAVTASLPVRQRRASTELRLEIALGIETSLELAGYQLMLFSRLVDEHSLADMQYPLRTSRTPQVEAAAAEPSQDLVVRRSAAAALVQRLTRSSKSVELAGSDCLKAPTDELHVDSPRKIAVVHDFLYVYAGAERVLEQILNVYSEADVFSLFDFVPEKHRAFLKGKKVKTTFLQRMPWARSKHRAYLPLMPLAIEQLDLSEYDIIISSSYVAAKGVITRSDQLHVCYCHTPARFAWDLQSQYLSQGGLIKGVKSFLARTLLHYIRNWDVQTANRVDQFLTNSQYVARRIAKVYRRSASVVYPPVDVDEYTLEPAKDDFYLTVSRLVPYKRIDLVVEAFTRIGNRRLVVIGTGPEMEKIKALAGPNVTLLGYQPAEQVKAYMQRAKAFVFAAEEDFGIVPVEAQACGTPVIAYERGGVTESVVAGRTGTFFARQTVESVIAAVRDFEANDVGWNPQMIRANAERFSAEQFRKSFRETVENAWMSFNSGAARERETAAAVETGGAGAGHSHLVEPSQLKN
jgi:UDP-N-acetylmuramyl pentapeptide phosphotransferase/UDP-N-acetylglucosamine-1-phosphate transferase/glycosyltransferase involved in cell wall biosynthesis